MYIGLYYEPVNTTLLNYKGLYRQNDIIGLIESDNYNLVSAIEWFFSVSREGAFLEYTERNKQKLVEFYSVLNANGWMGEMVLFTDCCDAIIPSDFVMIGYDICADSKYYSPIGDGLLRSYDKNEPFFSEMSTYEYSYYKNNINEVELFNSYTVALEFSNYCNTINKKHEHVIESENNWRPFAIYMFQKTKRQEKTGDGSVS